jgi:phosphatidylserine/phosphatidylglycerophosphate/cardiolipin synthase-like enzyme
MSRDELRAHVEEAARKLSAGQISVLADAIEGYPSATPSAKARATGAIASPAYADVAARLVDSWGAVDGLHGDALAFAIRSAAGALDAARAEQSIEVVWTGPQTTAVPVRLTRAVLIDVARAARHSLIVVSFAAYKVDVVLKELAAAADRGVVIRLILETGEASGGTLTFDAAQAFVSLRERVSFYIWPVDKRPALEKGRALLHAKAAIADDHTALVTSANLTGHGIAKNMELGLLVKGGPIPRRLSQHFRELMAADVLTEVLG